MIPSEAKVVCIQPVLKSIRNIKQMIVEKKSLKSSMKGNCNKFLIRQKPFPLQRRMRET